LTTASDPESVVRQVLAIAYDRGSADEVFARARPLLHPDAEYVNPPDAVESGTRRGHDGWRAAIASIREGLGPEASFEIIEMVSRDEKVFVRARVHTGTESGMEVAGPTLGTVWFVRDGLVHRMEWRWDPEEARALLDDAGGREG
jgi:hypothetical protein